MGGPLGVSTPQSICAIQKKQPPGLRERYILYCNVEMWARQKGSKGLRDLKVALGGRDSGRFNNSYARLKGAFTMFKANVLLKTAADPFDLPRPGS